MGGNSKLWAERQQVGGRLARVLHPVASLAEVARAFGVSKTQAQVLEREALYKVELRLKERLQWEK